MSDTKLISAIIIFLNAERFIEEAVESVFCQTYNRWELLLVDDGSTDRSTEIARWYAKDHPGKVRYLEHDHHENRGMSASRNLGVTHAEGEYIAFLDADDVWLPLKLEQQAALLSSHPEAAMVYGRTQIWHSWTGNPGDVLRDHMIELGVQPNTLVPPPNLFLLLLENKAQTPTTCNAMVRREVFEELGGFEDAFGGMYEDQVFFAKVHLEAPVFVADECWARYRQHSDSCSAVFGRNESYHAGRLPLLHWLRRHLAKGGVDQDSREWRALRRELWRCNHPHIFRLSALSTALARKKGLL